MYGPIAQLVEQLAFNQWVAGSSPARLTTRINELGQHFVTKVAAPFVFSVRIMCECVDLCAVQQLGQSVAGRL